MPSVDVTSKVDAQAVENAINVAKKEIVNRYDFHGSNTDAGRPCAPGAQPPLGWPRIADSAHQFLL